jgi:hypothetical protein
MRFLLNIVILLSLVLYLLILPLFLFLKKLDIQSEHWKNIYHYTIQKNTHLHELSKSEFDKSLINQKEIIINGQLYDIVNYTYDEETDKVILELIIDNEESEWLLHIQKFLKTLKVSELSIFSMVFYFSDVSISFIDFSLKFVFNNHQCLFLSHINLDVLTPPPKMF